MLPVSAATNTYTTPTPIVNTTIPGTTNTHTPPTIVAPSFSSAQIDNNARGNSEYIQSQTQELSAPALTPSTNKSVGVPQSPAERFTLGAQTNFLAQIIGQDSTPEVRGVLIQYEKMVSISNVKYAPSEAFRPQEQPSGVFGKLLQAESKAQTATSVLLTESSAAQTTAAANANRSVAEPPVLARNNKAQASFAQDLSDEEAAEVAQTAPAVPPRVINAYLSTASRVNSQSLEDKSSDDLVSQVA